MRYAMLIIKINKDSTGFQLNRIMKIDSFGVIDIPEEFNVINSNSGYIEFEDKVEFEVLKRLAVRGFKLAYKEHSYSNSDKILSIKYHLY